ncbi:ABC transporter ATP-binding protein [Salinarimonas ramus]|uniref:ABC transporter ATP-binding protein n=1 Tax=Salinarimonas ramus TaxID=690164 RepID=A0A917QA80_9HYPH|nr:ABC transporter ATP-binding protein [Salinarimonas ramus]GGK38250.1 ABC transporter ATP-binding protein [Salinarimonas ramus]
MLRSISHLYALLRPKDRRNGAILLAMMIVGAVLEVVGVAAIPAFVGIVVSPERLASIPTVGPWLIERGYAGSPWLVVWGALVLFAIFALKNAFLVANAYAQVRYMLNRRCELADRMMRAYLSAPYSFHLTRNTSELLRNVDRETNVVSQQVIGSLLEVTTKGVIAVSILGFLFVAEPLITLFWGLLFAGVMVLMLLATSRKLQDYARDEQANRKQYIQALYQAFGSIKEARVLGREGHFASRFSDGITRTAVAIRYKTFLSRIMPPMTEMLAITGLLALAVTLILLERPTDSILVTMSLFVVALVRLRDSFSTVMSRLADLRYSLVSIEPVQNELSKLETPASQDLQKLQRAPDRLRLHEAIRLEDVWYTHQQAERPALRGIDLTIPAGSAIGLVGSTGAGKSTVVDVVLGLLEPDRGAMRVDGTDIREAGVRRWQGSIGYVPQSIYLLDDTIRRNIALGVPDEEIDENALAAAIEAAQLGRFIDRQPHGLDTEVGENGLRISGGERQRIGIARALYTDPDVVILDEATSALDNTTERAVIEAVDGLRGSRTVIMIAHRLSTVRRCDTLYFLKDGRIEARGTYDELRESHDEFRLMAAE